MDDSAKYLIHAEFATDGVVERSDVVGAVFGQTEGLLGDELEIRDLQESAKLGRIDVEVESEGGQSHGRITIASSLDRVETATLAAALEAIERIGPCRSRVEISHIEDQRAAKRRQIVERAKELLATAFDEAVMDSQAILEEVRESVRVEDITTYEGLPAGPNVAESDALIVVEGRADVLNLLRYGIKNAIAVEGTNVPDTVAALTRERTVTAFLDGDHGGDLIGKELRQVGDIDYVAVAPDGRAVEDLSRAEVHTALREKVRIESLEGDVGRAIPNGEGVEGADGTASAFETTTEGPHPGRDSGPASTGEGGPRNSAKSAGLEPAQVEEGSRAESEAVTPGEANADSAQTLTDTGDSASGDSAPGDSASDDSASGDSASSDSDTDSPERTEDTDESEAPASPRSVDEHAMEVEGTGVARLLDADLQVVTEVPAAEAFEAIRDAESAPTAVVVDGPVDQRLVDVAAQRGVAEVIGTAAGEFVKQPTSVRVRTIEHLS
ncbi:MAG: DNA primase DnaG [Halodesulfurarchaeum sp.]